MTETNLNKTPEVATIYFGGTFGCMGTPLKPIGAKTLLPLLVEYAKSNHDVKLIPEYTLGEVQDSSQATLNTFVGLIKAILSCQKNGLNNILIIQGTDTVSYSAALVANVFAQSSLNIVFLVAMQPLIKVEVKANSNTFSSQDINISSDALANFVIACDYFREKISSTIKAGNGFNCFIAADTLLPAKNTFKMHKNSAPAFHAVDDSSYQNHAIECVLDNAYFERLENLCIQCCYCLPTSYTSISQELTRYITDNKTDAIFLVGYGAGNFPESDAIKNLLTSAYEKQILVFITSQVPFGVVTNDYASGSWLSQCHVLSANTLSIPSLFAKVAHICSATSDFETKQKYFLS